MQQKEFDVLGISREIMYICHDRKANRVLAMEKLSSVLNTLAMLIRNAK